jgi:hypothetical protein
MRKAFYILIGISIILFIGLTAQSSDDEPDKLIFNHKFHVEENEMSCTDCHSKASTSNLPDDNLNAKMEACADCHDISDKDECVTCHSNPENVIPAQGYFENYEFFSHQKHIQAGKDCKTCHAKIYQSTELGCICCMLPKMNDCIECHRAENKTLDCAACHYGNHPLPGDMNATEWTRMHGLEASFNPEKFKYYFDEGYCEDCHQGLNLKGEVHQPGWMFVHGDEALSGGDCLICHEDRSECSACHRAQLPVPHPLGDPTFANPYTGGDHREDAEAFFESCLACHDQGSASPTCARCHN